MEGEHAMAGKGRQQSTPGKYTGFDFTSRMRALCADITTRLPELAHIDIDRVSVTFSQARKSVQHGLYATLTPLRFERGNLTTKRSGRKYTVQRIYDHQGQEMLYILSFYLPRFMETDFNEKMVTVFHELWHISPSFDGDIRRHSGRCYAHSNSQEQYDAHMQVLVNRYMKLNPPESLFSFLRLTFHGLCIAYGSVYGAKLPHPKLIPMAG